MELLSEETAVLWKRVILRFACVYPKKIVKDMEKLGCKSGQPLDAPRTVPAAPATQNLQTPNASTTTIDSAPTPTNSSSQALDIPNTSQDVNELQQQ
ncbi:hypothetical protein Tco_0409710 [Tanacetum coccineum]